MSSIRQRNDRPDVRGRNPAGPAAAAADWVWGWHAVTAALANPARPEPRRLLVAADKLQQLQKFIRPGLRAETVEGKDLTRILPQGAVHQGVALRVDPPESATLEAIAEPASGVLLMLDQITDPQNVGAIFRNAAAFGARGVILQDRHAPPLAGAVAKASAGAIDHVPHVRAVNLSRALERLADLGWRAIGLAGEGEATLEEAIDGGPVVLVLGAEGEGVRRLVREHCDQMARIPMPGGFESLNVSAASAVALYEATRRRG